MKLFSLIFLLLLLDYTILKINKNNKVKNKSVCIKLRSRSFSFQMDFFFFHILDITKLLRISINIPIFTILLKWNVVFLFIFLITSEGVGRFILCTFQIVTNYRIILKQRKWKTFSLKTKLIFLIWSFDNLNLLHSINKGFIIFSKSVCLFWQYFV